VRLRVCNNELAFVRNRLITVPLALFASFAAFLAVAVAGDSVMCLNDKGAIVNFACTSSALANAYEKLGTESASKGDCDQAMDDFDKAIELSPNDAVAYFHRANLYSSVHDYDDAIQDYDVAIKLDANFAAAFNDRCFVSNAQGNYDRAIEDCTRAIILDPRQATFFIGRANAYNKKGDYARALRDYDQSILLNSTDSNAYIGRARVYLDKAIELDHDFANAWNNRCWVYAVINQLSSALHDCAVALALRPTAPHSLDSLAFTYLKMSEFNNHKNSDLDNAINVYNKALVISPNQASSLYGLGVAKLKKGDTVGGNAYVAAAKIIKPKIGDEFEKYGVLWPPKDGPN
jgi:tetratricopeptide (TPR) repeat protein